jgi:hypothetical protein
MACDNYLSCVTIACNTKECFIPMLRQNRVKSVGHPTVFCAFDASGIDISMKKPSGRSVFWMAAGGLAFWLPPVALSVVFRWNVSTVGLNVAALTGLAFLALLARVRHQGPPQWGWALAGIYILGPAAMLIASAFSRFPSSTHLPGDWLWITIFCFLPPMTLWLALLNGMILSVLLASAVLPLLAPYRPK